MGMLLQYHKETPKTPEEKKEVKRDIPKEVMKEVTKEVEIKKRKKEV